ISVGSYVQVSAANSVKMYQDFGATNTAQYENSHMRMQVFKVTAISGNTITIDKPLEFDVPANNTSDSSSAIDGKTYYSKVVPLTLVQNVGFENLYITQVMTGMPALDGSSYNLTPEQAKNNYGNLAPEYAQNGIVFKWAANSWVKNVRMFMTGSHPIVTEIAKNLRFEGNTLDGAWNKGKGGNGYFRGSRVWDSLYINNTTRNLRHFTFQWSASGNVARLNNFDSDLNLHGGWERYNLLEYNTVAVPFGHAPGNCTANCGTDGGGAESGQWYPIWWGTGAKATKWSGATGPRNIFLNNTMSKQTTAGGAFTPYYSETNRVYQFGWDRVTGAGSSYAHLATSGGLLADWAANETVDFSSGSNTGVNANCTYSGSLYLSNGTLNCTGGSTNPPPPPPPPPPNGSVQVRAALNADTTSRTKYDIEIKNTQSSAVTNLSARVYFDISEVLASGRSANNIVCDERFESIAATCSVVQYNGNVYYAKLDFGSASLAAGSEVTYKITVRLSDWSNNWSSSNDYSRVGLSSASSVTTKIPAFSGNAIIAGQNP
ncbi:MAG: hypothetical protein HC933_22085, partial [Pleurocapsa sp. SU_196_0]|nr:hypothetical protein [Pleurocapsa sp. SU_196_0]